jgi:hypothetical protein
MGGRGSGSWYRWSTRPVVEDGLSLDLCRLIRQGNVVPRKWVSGSLTWSNVNTDERTASIGYEANMVDPCNAWMRLHYKRNDTPEDYKVRLTTTRPNYGGQRWWFICPSRGIRTAKLYLANGGDWFASRQAYGLAYRSQSECREDRQATRAHRLRRKLGGHAGFEQPFPDKPKGMHWKTYQQMCDEIDYLEQTSMMSMMQRFGFQL